ncbi:hypothetical protein AB0F25_25155 [Streptomyces wedmorensis]|uniref:hypothetical protein n=1 Tax=Streptomyces wedmorensis TaxID=43759 RepID=UPI0034319277
MPPIRNPDTSGTRLRRAAQDGGRDALAGGSAVHHGAHALIALRFGSPPRRMAVWALPGVAIPLLVVLGADVLAPWLVALLAAEAIAHLLYAKTALSRRQAAGTA